MGTFMSRLFIDPTALPSDGYGFIQLLMLGFGYGFVLMHGSNMIKDGSELLLLVPWLAGVVGSVVLPVLGAVPDGAIVIFSGLGADAQEQIAVGVGALAGSTVMLLTVPWVLCLFGGRVNTLPNGEPNYIRDKSNPDWKKLDPSNKILGTGVRCGPVIGYSAKVMLATLVSFLIVQIPALVKHCGESEVGCESPPVAGLVGGIVATLFFCFYLWDQARIANQDEVKEDKIDELRRKAIENGLVTLRGLFNAGQVQDREGDVVIDKDSKRFQNLLRPFFRKYDLDNSGEISHEELRFLLTDLGAKPSKDQLEEIMKKMDTDNSGGISFSEFCATMAEALTTEENDLLTRVASTSEMRKSNSMAVNNESQPLLAKQSSTSAIQVDREVGGGEGGADAEEEGDDEEEEPEVPEDLASLPPAAQQRRILMRSCWIMGVGVFLVLFFSDPMVDVLSELGNRMNIKPFFVAFVLAPLASNASELIAAYAYSQKKTEKTITISFSSLIGAACMNNTFCLAIFLFLVYAKDLKWVFTAETFCIIAVEIAMFFIALRRNHPTWMFIPVALLFPAALGLVIIMEACGLD